MNVIMRAGALAATILAGACTSNALQAIDSSGLSLNGPVPTVAAENDVIAAIIAEVAADAPPEFAEQTSATAAAAPADEKAAETAVADPPRPAKATQPQAVASVSVAAPVKKKSFFSAFWPSREDGDEKLVTASLNAGDGDRPAAPKSSSGKGARLARGGTDAKAGSASTFRASASALPGVRTDELFEIKHGTGKRDDSNVDAHEADGSYRVASIAGGLARTAPNGLRTQRPDVDVSCLKPNLVRMLKTIERHYGRPVVVTSGFRDPGHNRRVNGARNSMHMHCAAADIQVAGVSKWELAKFVRNLPGRGGVGTYCHTASVHVDVGPQRDWNWRCRRRRG